MDRDTITALTVAVAVYRRLRQMGIYDMPIEMKGLKGKALKAGAMFDRVNKAYDKLIETGEAHATDVESLPGQFEAMQDDITFAVQTLGNSVNGSGESTEKAKTEPAITAPDGFDLTPGAVNRVDAGAQGVALVPGFPVKVPGVREG